MLFFFNANHAFSQTKGNATSLKKGESRRVITLDTNNNHANGVKQNDIKPYQPPPMFEPQTSQPKTYESLVAIEPASGINPAPLPLRKPAHYSASPQLIRYIKRQNKNQIEPYTPQTNPAALDIKDTSIDAILKLIEN